MADEESSSKALLERLCALQEEQLALTRKSLERHARLTERQEKQQELWEQQVAEPSTAAERFMRSESGATNA